MKVLCVGESNYDIFVSSEYFPQENTKNRFSEKIECGGGLIPNSACMLSSFGVETYVATSVGSDDFGGIIKKELENKAIKIDYIETNYSGKTNISMYLYNKATKSCTNYNVNSGGTIKKYAFSITPDFLVYDGTDYGATRAVLDKYKDTKSLAVIDIPTKENIDLIKYASHVVFSAAGAEAVSGMKIDYANSNSLVTIYNELKQKYSNAQIIINIVGYGVVYSMNNEIKIMPTLNSVEKIDFTGEMDAFVGMYTYGLLNNFDPERGVAYGIIAGSLTSTRLGSRSALPSHEEIVGFYNQKYNLQHADAPVSNVAPNTSVASYEQVNVQQTTVEPIVNNNDNK